MNNLFNTSSLQQKNWLLQKYSTSNLLASGLLEIQGDLDLQKLENVINKIIYDHDILSTNYISKSGLLFPYQQVNKSNKIKIQTNDLTGIKIYEDRLSEIQNFLHTKKNEKINYEQGSIVQSVLFKVKENLNFLYIIIPSISADSYTILKFLKDIIANYSSTSVPQFDILQYSQFSGWHDSLQEDPEKEAVDFWNDNSYEKYKNPYNYLYQGYENVKNQSALEFEVNPLLSTSIKNIALELNCKPLSIFLAGLFTLNYLSSNTKSLIGVMLSDRIYQELEHTYGMVSKTIPVGIDDFDNFNFKKLINYIDDYLQQAASLQDYFSPIDSAPKLDNKICGYSIITEYLNIENSVSTGNTNFQIKDVSCHNELFKLKLTFVDSLDKLVLNYTFSSDDLMLDELKHFHKNYYNLLAHAIQHLEAPIVELSNFESNLFNLEKLNKVQNHNTINSLFEKQVLLNTHKNAVVCNGISLTYAELNAKANTLAYRLRKSGVSSNDVVAILGDRSLNMIIGILAIIKSGGAFLPVDISYPEERIKFMLKDSKVKTLLLTSEQPVDLYTEFDVLDINKVLKEDQDNARTVNDVNKVNDLVYVIYTSGSTGYPKGVMIEHQNLNSLVVSLNEIIYKESTSQLNIGLVASFSFDGSIKQIFSSLLLGHCLHIVSDEIKRNSNLLVQYFVKNQIDITDITPMYLDVLVGEDFNFPTLGVKYFLCGGQQLYAKTIRQLRKKYPEIIVVNLYGPTECCVDATYFKIGADTDLSSENLPIGFPLLNTNIFILNNEQQAVPNGIIGEICISGNGVGRGYIHQSELTNEKFVDLDQIKQRIYKTGDLGKINYDGTIEFLGRNDNQIKIRGYRVELDEIRRVIVDIEQIKDCYVTVDKSEKLNGQIIAYVILKDDIDLEIFYGTLKKHLPEYMIPNYLVRAKKFNININGKIDINSLPNIELNLIKSQSNYEVPRNHLESELIDIIKNLRGLSKVSIHDSFYDLGMDSIKVLQLLAQIGKKGYHFPVNELFANPTVAKLSSIELLKTDYIDQSKITGELRLSPIQKHYLENIDVDQNHFNQSLVLKILNRVKIEDIQKVFLKIIEHHDQLRAVFKLDKENRYKQYIIDPPENIDVEVIDLSNLPLETSAQEYSNKILSMQGSLNLEDGLLIKVALFKFDDFDRLFITMHHLICDAYSWRILLEDIETLYIQLQNNEPLELPLKTNSYQEWTSKLHQYANSDAFDEKSQYWNNFSAIEIPKIPKDQPQGTSFNYDSLVLDKQVFLSKLAINTDLKDILLPAFGLAVKEIFDLNKIGLFIYGLGRDEAFTKLNLSRSLGWFTSLYPFIIDMSDSVDLNENIDRIKQDIRNVPDKGVGYGMLKYLTDSTKLATENFTPNILLNYLGRFDSSEGDFQYYIEDVNMHNISKNRKQRFDIIIVSSIVDGTLGISIEFNKKQYSTALITKLLDGFIDNIKLNN